MIYSSIEHDRTSKAVEQQIKTLILEGILRVGDGLPGERELSKNLNVSRPILREALAALEKRGLLKTSHGGGTIVADIIGTVFAEPVVELIGENPKAKADYLEFRREVEGLTAAMAAQKATQADKQLLEQIINDMEAAHAKQDPKREAEIDVEFHTAIGECAHNIVLLHTLRSCYKLLLDDVFLNRELLYGGEGMREKMLDQHKAIYTAVITGDARAASRAAQAHIRFIEKATHDMENSYKRNTVSALRLNQRNKKPKRRLKKAVN